jgi:hypothetical protein
MDVTLFEVEACSLDYQYPGINADLNITYWNVSLPTSRWIMCLLDDQDRSHFRWAIDQLGSLIDSDILTIICSRVQSQVPNTNITISSCACDDCCEQIRRGAINTADGSIPSLLGFHDKDLIQAVCPLKSPTELWVSTSYIAIVSSHAAACHILDSRQHIKETNVRYVCRHSSIVNPARQIQRGYWLAMYLLQS